MTFTTALKRTLLSVGLFAVVYTALTLLGDWYWQRPVPVWATVANVALASVIFWAFVAHRLKARNA